MSATNIKPIEPVECPTLDKAQEHGLMIQIINQWIFQMDEAFLLDAAKQLREKADRYDAASVLVRSWNQYHSKTTHAEADALEYLAKYILANKKVTDLRGKESDLNARADELAKLFT